MTSWDGEFVFGETWGAFRGQGGDNSLHAHAALQVCIARYGQVTVRPAAGLALSGPALLVRSGVSHALQPTPDVLLIFLEPQSATARRLDTACPGGPITAIPAINLDRLDPDAPLARCCEWLADGRDDADAAPDPRLLSALAHLRTASGPRLIERAAAVARLSPSRLRSIAAQTLGTSLTSWLMWRRLERAGRALADGASLADAAFAAGFADQAHLSRTCRKVYGISPGAAAPVLRDSQSNRSRPGAASRL